MTLPPSKFMVELRAAREAEADRMTDQEALAILDGAARSEPGPQSMVVTLMRLSAANVRARRALAEKVEREARP